VRVVCVAGGEVEEGWVLPVKWCVLAWMKRAQSALSNSQPTRGNIAGSSAAVSRFGATHEEGKRVRRGAGRPKAEGKGAAEMLTRATSPLCVAVLEGRSSGKKK
jgi:hypothetical protein